MIHPEVRSAVESGDISSLKYIFCDCLDGDPTFSKYEEDYEYCKSKGVLFVPHSELHPMNCNSVTDEYWVQLKKDFMQNPSVERMEHMREAAKILYSSRIRKIEEDNARKAVSKSARSSMAQPSAPSSKPMQQAKPSSKPARKSDEIRRVSEPVNKDGIRRVSEPVHDDGIRRVSEPVHDDGIRRVSEPVHDDGIRRVSEPVHDDSIRRVSEPVNNDGIRRVSEPVRTAPTSQGTQSKKADGVGRVAALVVAAIVVIVIICLIIK